jgi:hypothetical protein
MIEVIWKQQWQYTDAGTFDRTTYAFLPGKVYRICKKSWDTRS